MSHHHHNHYPPSPSPSCCCCCSAAASSFHCCGNTPPPPNPTNADHLLQTLILLQSQQPQPVFLNPRPQNPLRPGPKHRDAGADGVDGGLSSILRSLSRRVAALESSSSPRHTPSAPKQRRQSLRDAAAATIQRHFRRFLARRSRALRDLKQLASVRSHAAALRSSLSDKTLANARRVSERAEDLLSQLDSVQSSDPMIREGKRSVSRELVRISEFVGKVLIKESSDPQSQLEELERRRDRGRRRVSFAENDGREDNLFDDFPERIADIEEEALRGFYDRSSDDEESPRVMRHERANGFSQRMAPPLPVRMEPMRNGSMKNMVADEED